VRTIRVFMLPRLVRRADLGRTACAVVDLIRATTTITAALACGAKRVVPTAGVAEVRRLVKLFGREGTVTAGERGGERIAGLDLGNSPLEHTRENVGGKTVLLTTTNGTRALLAVRGAQRVLVGSLVNASACAEALAQSGCDAAVVCAGTEGAVALDDTLAAGVIVKRLLEIVGPVELDDSARLALAMADWAGDNLLGALRQSAASRKLEKIGLGADVDEVAKVDLYPIVPEAFAREKYIEIIPFYPAVE